MIKMPSITRAIGYVRLFCSQINKVEASLPPPARPPGINNRPPWNLNIKLSGGWHFPYIAK